MGDWVLVRFPKEETGRQRKLSWPWYGPYLTVTRNDSDLTVVRVYYPQEKAIQIHQQRVTPCPLEFPSGYYLYESKWQGAG